MYLEQNSRSITLDILASTNHLFRFKPHSAKINSRLNHLLQVVQDWYRSIFWIKVQEPYPLSDGGQNLGALEVLPVPDHYIYANPVISVIPVLR